MIDNETDLFEKIQELENLVRKHELILRLMGQGLALGGFMDPIEEDNENERKMS